MQIQTTTTRSILDQIAVTINQLSDEQYAVSLPVLSNNSIGKHVRHVIEFYECLILGYESGAVNYDLRKRNPQLENQKSEALKAICAIQKFIDNNPDKSFLLLSSYPGSEEPSNSQSSYKRELIYNIEHAIHHMAIIKIAVTTAFPDVTLPDNFGIAYSTIQYKEQCAQ